MTITYKRTKTANWPDQNVEISETQFLKTFEGSVIKVARWLENLVSGIEEMMLYDNKGELVGGHIYAKKG